MTDPAAVVGSLLRGSTLQGLIYTSASMERLEAPPPGTDQLVPVDITVDFQMTENLATFRVTASVARQDIRVAAAVAIQYSIPEIESLADEAVRELFTHKVVIPAAYPYLRAKIQGLSFDAGTMPVVLSILDMTRLPPPPPSTSANA